MTNETFIAKANAWHKFFEKPKSPKKKKLIVRWIR